MIFFLVDRRSNVLFLNELALFARCKCLSLTSLRCFRNIYSTRGLEITVFQSPRHKERKNQTTEKVPIATAKKTNKLTRASTTPPAARCRAAWRSPSRPPRGSPGFPLPTPRGSRRGPSRRPSGLEMCFSFRSEKEKKREERKKADDEEKEKNQLKKECLLRDKKKAVVFFRLFFSLVELGLSF